jgi:hypothetical protein
MPYYNDPSSDIAAGMQGNFNPMTGRLNAGNMVLEFLARLAGQKEKAKQDEWAVEDRDLKKRLVEAQIGNYAETTTPRDYETPEQRTARETANKNLEHKFRLEEIDRANSFRDKVATSKDAEDEAKLAAAELRRIGLASKVERAQRQKKHTLLRTQIEAIDKRLLALAKQYSSANSGGDALLANSTKSEIDRITSQKELLDAEMYNLSADVIGAVGETPAKVETKSIGGVTYYKWSDGKWRDSKEPTPTKK